ncbi:MAG: purine-binding chemotaxis protein CheW [Deltaproteobacteria bacterium]|nr:purine-binding chemotaxis protein CheW [Deltaproteobacteria bacterium]TLN05177.1 MAG: purine-binding chemotaxis protein CheW [bacterium]
MNLAEIRKKAHLEKNTEVHPSEPVSPPDQVSVRSSDAAEQNIPEVLAEEVSSETSGEDVSELPAASEIPAELPSSFDPAALILAGRQSAGLASEVVDTQQQDAAAISGEVLKYLRFRVADEEYGVNLLEIREIIKLREITEVPGMPDFVTGVLSLRGIIIPVFDLRLRLGLGVNEAPGRERIIVARMQERIFGLIVDEVFQVINLSAAAIEAAPAVLEGIDREFVSGIGRHGQLMLILLELEKIVDISLL